MSMNDFVQTLSDEQKAALLKALTGDDFKPEVESRFQHEEPISEAVDGTIEKETKSKPTAEDFAMHKQESSVLGKNRRRETVKAQANTWTDTGEHKDVSTPDTARTPRNRAAPKKKKVRCHVCGKDFTINASLVYGEFYRCDRCTG
tara:strand:+ start:683 stop:1120 length:438 start_codon:yes stop_codon:yes gene_type:complete